VLESNTKTLRFGAGTFKAVVVAIKENTFSTSKKEVTSRIRKNISTSHPPIYLQKETKHFSDQRKLKKI
jgi:hypothetical protein